MKTFKSWMIGAPILLTGMAAVTSALADESDMALAMASLKAGMAKQSQVHPAHDPTTVSPEEVCALVEKVTSDAADPQRVGIERMAIESVFVDRAVERLNAGAFPGEAVIISSTSAFDMSAYDSSWPRRDPAARLEIKLLGDWWTGDFGARHGESGLTFGASGTYRETPSYPQWVEDDARFTLDAMLTIGGLSLYGAVIDKEADAPFAGHMTDNQGAMVQAGFFVIPNRLEPFLRYEWPGLDAVNEVGGVSTVGVNYYIKPHAARFTLAVAWTDPGRGKTGAPSSFDGGGLVRDGTRDQVSLRAQIQLLF